MTLVSILTPCFRAEPYLEGYFEAVLAQTALDKLEVVLVHNEPSAEECVVVRRVSEGHPGLVRHIVVPEGWDADDANDRGRRSRATVSQSMNRGIAAASGRYVALWNVDDVRRPDSIEAQLRTFDEHPEALMTYGDMVIVPRYGDTEGELVTSPEFERNLFMRGCFGAFQMYRRDAFETVGLYDEQLRSGYDFDMQIRFAANGDLVRTPRVLGYFTNAGTGLSTTSDDLQPTERTVIEMRYGILDKIDRRYLARASRYRVGELRTGDRWLPIERFVPDLDALLARAAADPRLQPTLSRRDRIGGRLRNVARGVRAALHPGGERP